MSEENLELPQGWGWANLGDLAEVIRGVTYEKNDAQNTPGDGLVPILRATNIADSLDFTDLVYVPAKYVKKEQYLRAGDIVIAASSGSRQVVGKAAQLTSSWNGSFGAFCFTLRPCQEVAARYLAIFLKTAQYRNRISALAAGININNLRAEHLKTTPIPLAPLSEQARVVAEVEQQLSRLDAAVSSLQKVQANLKRYRAAVLKTACEGRLVPQPMLTPTDSSALSSRGGTVRRGVPAAVPLSSEAESIEVAPGWDLLSVADLLRKGLLSDVKDGNHGTNHPKKGEFSDNGLPFITAEHVAEFKINYSAAPKLSGLPLSRLRVGFVKPGDVILTHKGSVGRTAICEQECVLSPQTTYYRFHEDSFDRRFLMYYFASPQFQQQLAAVKGQTTRDYVPISQQYKLFILVPPRPLQTLIAKELDRILSVTAILESDVEASLKRAERVRQSILLEAFQGRLVPQDPKDEPAFALLERIRQAKASQASEPRARKARTKPVLASPPSPPPPVLAKEPPTVAEPEPEPQEADFLRLPRDEQVDIVWETLLGQGPLEKDTAIRAVADELRGLNLARFKRLRQDGPLYDAIGAAIEKGVREGDFDRLRRGCIRAVLTEPKDYTDEVWQRCLLAVTGDEPAEIEDTLRAAAEWARETMGLEFARLREDGVILTGLREALEDEVRAGRIVRRGGRVRRPSGPTGRETPAQG